MAYPIERDKREKKRRLAYFLRAAFPIRVRCYRALMMASLVRHFA